MSNSFCNDLKSIFDKWKKRQESLTEEIDIFRLQKNTSLTVREHILAQDGLEKAEKEFEVISELLSDLEPLLSSKKSVI